MWLQVGEFQVLADLGRGRFAVGRGVLMGSRNKEFGVERETSRAETLREREEKKGLRTEPENMAS